MLRNSGSRTGQKHLKRKDQPPADDDGASEQPRLAALKAAVTAAEAAVRVAEGDDAGVRSWLNDLLQQVERQVQIDEDQAEEEREQRDEQRDVYMAAAVACVEAIKRRTVRQSPTDAERARMQPFKSALVANLRAWSQSYPADKCDKCEKHLAWCLCRGPCSKCGQRAWRRAWRLYCVYPANVCQQQSRFKNHRSSSRVRDRFRK